MRGVLNTWYYLYRSHFRRKKWLTRGSTDVMISVLRLDDEGGEPIGAAVLTGTVGVKKSVGGKGGGGGDKGGKGKGKGPNR